MPDRKVQEVPTDFITVLLKPLPQIRGSVLGEPNLFVRFGTVDNERNFDAIDFFVHKGSFKS